MNNFLFIPIAIIYFLVTGLLFLYGVNFMYMTYVSLREGRQETQKAKALRRWPKVTVQLPIYNEMYVAERLVEAAANLDYPRSQLEIQVLDDFTDETKTIVAGAIKRARAAGVNIRHMHRKVRSGYKAGALRDGFSKATGEFFALFDADFLPPRDFLRRTLPHFDDRKIGFIQTRWGHLNREFSFLTLLQSLAIDAHFMVEQFARSHTGLWFNFNGTAGVWRRQAIEAAGGWKADTLTEDLDLSYRAFLKGYKAKFLGAVETPAELPITFNAFRRQQHRWARGSLECAVQLLPVIWNSGFELRYKISSSFHLLGYGVHLLLFAYCLLQPAVILLSRDFPQLITLFSLAYIFSTTALAPSLMLFTGQYKLGRPWWRVLPIILFITAFGAGMMINTLRAALEILNRKPAEFRRTPKFGDKPTNWMRQQYHLNLDPIVFWELIFAVFNLATFFLGIASGYLVISLYAGLFAFGFIFNAIYTIRQTINIARVQKAALDSP